MNELKLHPDWNFPSVCLSFPWAELLHLSKDTKRVAQDNLRVDLPSRDPTW